MMYNQIVKDCFFLPRHVGTLDVENPLVSHTHSGHKNQTKVIEFYMQCRDSDGEIVKACFKANGNPFVIAALEWICREIEGQHLAHLPVISYQILIKVLEIPTSQYPVALLVEGVYKDSLLLMKNKLEDVNHE